MTPSDHLHVDEFLHFLAEVLDPRTGRPKSERLLSALKLPPRASVELAEGLISANGVEILGLLDLLEAVHDRLGSMGATRDWFLCERLPTFDGRTPLQVCLKGELEALRRSQRNLLQRKCLGAWQEPWSR